MVEVWEEWLASEPHSWARSQEVLVGVGVVVIVVGVEGVESNTVGVVVFVEESFLLVLFFFI